jgi:hypothetical protein
MLAPKVHPLTRLAEADDPMEIVADAAPGDPDYMLECMVDEMSWGGMTEDEVLGLFHDPGYPVLNQLLGFYGCDAVRDRVRDLFARREGFRVTAVVDETPDPDLESDDGLELIQLTVRSSTGRDA